MINFDIEEKMTEEKLQNIINYELSKQIISRLQNRKFITKEQFEDIDKLNKESFKVNEKW